MSVLAQTKDDVTEQGEVTQPGQEMPDDKLLFFAFRKMGSSGIELVIQLGQMTDLLFQVVKSAVLHPIGYWGDVREQSYALLRQCWLPMIISIVVFGFGTPGLQGGNAFLLFGVPERLGSFFIVASVREFAPWITAMIVAGVLGTAITSDLGARRIREEFDAMEVLGVDPVRDVILPRIIAVALMTGLLEIAAMCLGVIGGLIAAYELGANPYAYFSSFWINSTTMDISCSVAKTFLFGLIIGVVCCYKGYHAKGGASGVARAVNQAVVLAFAGIWCLNWSFTETMLGLNPNMLVYR